MDPFSQALLGAATAQTFFTKKLGKKALPIGILGGLAADFDVVFSFFIKDPLTVLSLHRHFTHSFFFIPLGALFCFLILMLIPSFRSENKKDIYLCSLLAYATHAPLDLMTSYGTLIFWPLTNERFGLDFISIIDPIYTFPLFIGVLFTFIFKTKKPAQWALIFSLVYLCFGFYQKNQALKIQKKLAQDRGHQIIQSKVIPSLGNLVLWRSVYETSQNWGSEFYVDSIRSPLFKPISIRTGGSLKKFSLHDIPSSLPEPQKKAVQTVLWFSDGYLGIENADDPQNTRFIDVRYSPLPWSLKPLWYLKLNHSFITGSKESAYLWIQSRDFSGLKEFRDEVFGSKN